MIVYTFTYHSNMRYEIRFSIDKYTYTSLSV